VCGGALVKSLRCYLILILLGLSSSAALATGIPDPKILLGPTGTNFSYSQSACQASEFPTCFFTTDGTGMAVIDITNDLEAFIVQDTVTVYNSDDTLVAGLTCAVNTETAPGWTAANATANPCVFNGGFISPGFKYGLTASLFANNTTYLFDLREVTAATIPEPGTIILLGTGLAAVAAGRKKGLKGAKHLV
jgi:hypothetical protein